MQEPDKRPNSKQSIIAVVILFVVIIVALVISLTITFSRTDQNQGASTEASGEQSSGEVLSVTEDQTPTSENCIADECLRVESLEYPVGQLPDDVLNAVYAALDDEYKAYSTYNSVIARLGQIRPFAMIIRSEETHMSLLKAILDKYGELIPANPYEGGVEVANTEQANCQIGVDAETANVALYRDELLPVVTAYSDIADTFNRLMSASSDSHLPAFEGCN